MGLLRVVILGVALFVVVVGVRVILPVVILGVGVMYGGSKIGSP